MTEEHEIIGKLREALQSMGAIRNNSVYSLNTLWREVWATVAPDKDGNLQPAKALAAKLGKMGLEGSETEIAVALGELARAILAGKHGSMRLWVQGTGSRQKGDWWNNYAWSLPPEAVVE